MTAAEIDQALALERCTFTPGSTEKRFVRWAAGVARQEPMRELSRKAHIFLNRLAHSYRRQLGACMAISCDKCRPEAT